MVRIEGSLSESNHRDDLNVIGHVTWLWSGVRRTNDDPHRSTTTCLMLTRGSTIRNVPWSTVTPR